MRTDTYTKAVLTVIAFLLLLIACNQYVNPESKARAEGPFAGLQFSATIGQIYLFDTRSGDIWGYAYDDSHTRVHLFEKLKLITPGQLVVEQTPK